MFLIKSLLEIITKQQCVKRLVRDNSNFFVLKPPFPSLWNTYLTSRNTSYVQGNFRLITSAARSQFSSTKNILEETFEERKIMYTELQDKFNSKKYQEGIQLTQEFIQKTTAKYGESYSGYENDLIILGKLNISSQNTDCIETAIDLLKKAFNLALQRESKQALQQSMDQLFYIWKTMYDFSGINEISKNLIKKLCQMSKSNSLFKDQQGIIMFQLFCGCCVWRLDTNIEDYFHVYLILGLILREQGQFNESNKIIEECAGLLEQQIEQQDKLVLDLNLDITNCKENDVEKIEIIQRFHKCQVSIQLVYLSLFSNALAARNWKIAEEYLSCVEKFLEQMWAKQENQKMSTDLQKSQKELLSELELNFFQAKFELFFQQNKLEQAEIHLNLFMRTMTMRLKEGLFRSNNSFQKVILRGIIRIAIEKKDTGTAEETFKILDIISGDTPLLTGGIDEKLRLKLRILQKDRVQVQKSLEICIQTTKHLIERDINFISFSKIEAEYHEFLKDYNSAISKWNDCVIKANKFYGRNAEQTHRLKTSLCNAQVIQAWEDRQNPMSHLTLEQLNRIDRESQESFKELKEMRTFWKEDQQKLENIAQKIKNLKEFMATK